ncbi:TPA: phage tail tape measure protein [Klebsiella aerogenes]
MASNKNYQLAFEIGGKIAASLPKSFNVAYQAVAKLNTELVDLSKDQGEIQKLQAMKSKVGQTALEYHKAAARVEELQRQISSTENPTKAMIREFERAKTQSSNLRDSLRSQRDQLATLKSAYSGADTSARGLTAREKELKLSIDRNREAQAKSVEQVMRYKTALAQARTNVKDMKQAQDELNKSLERQRELRLGKLAETKSQLISSGVQTLAFAGGVGASAVKAASYNRENVLINNTVDEKDRMDPVKMTKNQMATAVATGQFASDIQASMGYLVGAGQQISEANANLKTLGMTATATGSDILDVSKASFTLSDSLKISPTQMKSALGILVQAGKEGSFEFKDMAKTLPVLGAQFQALKMGGTEAAATMGAALQIARKGASTSDEAANNMNNFMAKILAPDTLRKAKKNFGVDLYSIITDAQTKGKNPFEVAMKSVMAMTKNGNQKLIGELFGDMQVQNFVRPMIQNWELYQEIKKKTLNSGNVIDEDFAMMMKDNAERLKMLRIQSDVAANSFGQALQPALNKVLGVLVPLITKVAEFTSKHPVLISQITMAIGAVLGFRTAILACRVAMLALAVATNLTPFGWIRAAIMALIFAGTLLYQNWDKIKAYALSVWPTIKDYGVNALNALKYVFMNFTPVGWLIQGFKAGADLLRSINWSDSGAKIIDTLIAGIKSKADALVNEVKGIFAKVRDYLPFSDAKVGPFSELTRSGGAIMSTLALGVNGSKHLQAAVSAQFNKVNLSPNILGRGVGNGLNAIAGPQSRGFGAVGQLTQRVNNSLSSAGNQITYSPTIHLPAGTPEQTHDAAKRALSRSQDDFEKRMRDFGFQQRRLSYE